MTGRERFGWTQASSPSDASILQFAVYVDGTRRVLDGVVCTAGSGGRNLDCNAPLPSMTAGRHSLELAAFYPSGGGTVEGPRSTPLQLTIASVVASAGATAIDGLEPPHSGSVTGSDGQELHAEIAGSGLMDPVDVAVDAVGRSFVAERAGTIRILDRDASASDGDRTDDLFSSRNDGGMLLSLALAPDFAESHLVYVLQAEQGDEESRAAVVRYREVNGRFGQAAVVATAMLPPGDPAGVIRFGPDGALYLGLGSRTADAATLRSSRGSGRILRLLPDGRTPRDNPRASPVYSSGHRDPSGFAWHRTGGLWEVESGIDADELNTVRAGADYGWPSVSGRARFNGAASPVIALPAGTIPSGVTTVNDRSSPLDGDLIVSSLGLRDLLRISMSADGRPGSSEPVRLLQGRFGAIAQVTAGPDGALFFVTRNREAWGAGHDVLVRLTAR